MRRYINFYLNTYNNKNDQSQHEKYEISLVDKIKATSQTKGLINTPSLLNALHKNFSRIKK